MDHVARIPLERMGFDFIAPEHIPAGEDEYYLRERQQFNRRQYRKLRAMEIEVLVKNENTCDDWGNIRVTDSFDPSLVKSCRFFGMNRIGDLEASYLVHHDLRLPVGLSGSTIVSCDIGSHVAIVNVHYLAHYIIGDEVVLFNIDEMHTSDHAKFGNGILKDGEPEKVRVQVEVWNEMGGRAILPFDGMRPADAYLWARYRGETKLMERLREITDATFDTRRGYYGTVGTGSVIKHCRIIKDVAVGAFAYIKGANKLKNLTINSDADEPTQIGEGVELVNGIIAHGCHVFYGVKAVRFVMSSNARLKYGARLINSYLGDNATISCCEVLHSLIFPSHEQHHNSSFLIAALLQGQSNVAAGATIGSNHNSRSNDGEIIAKRGFWPGLCTNFKHSCRFAAYTLVAKGNYPAELNVTLPFGLLANDDSDGSLTLMPAYWFLYNMYAYARNASKFRARDQRVHKSQPLEYDALAPDTVEEIFTALDLLECWTGKAWLRAQGRDGREIATDDAAAVGRDLLMNRAGEVARLEVLGEDIEKSRRKVRILKPAQAHAAYREMVLHYAVRILIEFMETRGLSDIAGLVEVLGTEKRQRHWINLGGQITPQAEVEALKQKIVSGELDSWDAIHAEYDLFWQEYPLRKARHALATLCDLRGLEPGGLDRAAWKNCLARAVDTQHKIAEQTLLSRTKDYSNPFRTGLFESKEEMEAVFGRLEENDFIRQMSAETHDFRLRVEKLLAAMGS